MATLESLKRKVDATEDLQSVVKTMKALAAVNIRQYEEAAEALQDYRRAVELGLRVVLRDAQSRQPTVGTGQATGCVIVIGSDQGMCGQFNEDVAEHAVRMLRARSESASQWLLLAVGEKLAASLDARGEAVTIARHVPGSAASIAAHVRELLTILEDWQGEHAEVDEVILVYNRSVEHSIRSEDRRLLPMDQQWLQRIQEEAWPTRVLPMHAASVGALMSHLVRQYLFIELFGALAESLAAENATRLRAMQSAENNVEERLDELTTQFHRQRQNSITAELLDVISGSEAVAT